MLALHARLARSRRRTRTQPVSFLFKKSVTFSQQYCGSEFTQGWLWELFLYVGPSDLFFFCLYKLFYFNETHFQSHPRVCTDYTRCSLGWVLRACKSHRIYSGRTVIIIIIIIDWESLTFPAGTCCKMEEPKTSSQRRNQKRKARVRVEAQRPSRRRSANPHTSPCLTRTLLLDTPNWR